MSIIRPICVLLTVLVGCGPTYYIALKPEHAAAITTTRVHATIVQEEVEASVVEARTQVTQGGLVGALVGAVVDAAITSHRASEAEKRVEPIRKEMADFDFRDAFCASLQRTLPSLHALRVANLTTGKAPRTPEVLAALRARGGEDTLLTLVTDYKFSPDFHTFHVLTIAEIWRRDQPDPRQRGAATTRGDGADPLYRGAETTGGDGPYPLYRGTFEYVSEPIVASGDDDAAAQAWAADGAAVLHAAMREGIAETMKMLALDLAPGAAGPATHTTSAARSNRPARVALPAAAPPAVAAPMPVDAMPAVAAPPRAAPTGTLPTVDPAEPPRTAALEAPAVTASPAAPAAPAAARPTGSAVVAGRAARVPVDTAQHRPRRIVRRDNGMMYSAPIDSELVRTGPP
jgi:hypothetical protein